MCYDLQQAIQDCCEDPFLIFTYIKKGYYEVVEKLIQQNQISVNLCDSVGNDVVTRLLKAKQYDMVLTLMKKRNWDVNHQNVDGDTFGHILAADTSIVSLEIVKELMKKKNYLPNIQNHKGQTVLDIAISHHDTFIAFKILEDKRFTNIDVLSFKNLCSLCIQNVSYGKYSKLTNLDAILGSMKKKRLVPGLENIIERIHDNLDLIKKEIMNNRFNSLEVILNSSIYPVYA